MNTLVDRALDPLDRARRTLIRQVVRVPVARRVLVQREVRVPVLLSVHAACAFLIAVLAPSFSLVLGPVVLGVPHLAADVRYLVLRRQLPAWWMSVIALFAAALLALRALRHWDPWHAPPIGMEHILGSSWLLAGVITGALSRERNAGVLPAAALSLAVPAFAWSAPDTFQLALLHGHNVIAIAIWVVLFRRRQRCAWLAIGLVAAGAALLASGVCLPLTLRHGRLDLFGLHLFLAADWIAPGLSDMTGVALTLSFAFLQSVHYAVWLIGIPQDDARAEGSPSFRMAYRALVDDFGRGGLAAISCSAVLVIAAAARSPVATRNLVVSLAAFHAWLELALLGFFVARGRMPSRSSAA